jgi:drug/metabolite transporter (DMT)-like permease
MKPMSALALLLCVACQLLIVVGQLFLKNAVNANEDRKAGGPAPGGAGAARTTSRRASVRDFALGVACMTVWFFLWLGLLNRWEISKLYPFEGLNPALMAVGAWLVLKERLPLSAWLGLALVCAGIAVVAGS